MLEIEVPLVIPEPLVSRLVTLTKEVSKEEQLEAKCSVFTASVAVFVLVVA